MEKSGILIRSCDNYRGLERGYSRIAVRTHAENERLVAALEAVLQPPVIEPVAAETVTVTVEQAQQSSETQVLPSEEEVPSQAQPGGGTTSRRKFGGREAGFCGRTHC